MFDPFLQIFDTAEAREHLDSVLEFKRNERRKRLPGFKLRAGAILAWAAVNLTVWGSVGFIVYHFVSKYW